MPFLDSGTVGESPSCPSPSKKCNGQPKSQPVGEETILPPSMPQEDCLASEEAGEVCGCFVHCSCDLRTSVCVGSSCEIMEADCSEGSPLSCDKDITDAVDIEEVY